MTCIPDSDKDTLENIFNLLVHDRSMILIIVLTVANTEQRSNSYREIMSLLI